MRITYKIFTLIFILSLAFIENAQGQKIIVSEDAFIQGGEASGTAFGETTPKNLRIFKSLENSKYSRITYLKFKLPKNLNTISSIELNILLKVYKDEENPVATFNLVVFASENDNWNELSITWDDALKLGSKLGETEIKQSFDDKNQMVRIKLNANEVSKFVDGKKDRDLTLALFNYNFNKISAMAASKEQSKNAAAFLLVE